MQAIGIVSLCLGLASGSFVNPLLFLSYQDGIGQYSFGYGGPLSARSEYRTSDGSTRGFYSYVGQDGLLRTAEYEAGRGIGFRIKATDPPGPGRAVQDSPEVKAAREGHPESLEESRRRELSSGLNEPSPSLIIIRDGDARNQARAAEKSMLAEKSAEQSVERLQIEDSSIEPKAKILPGSSVGWNLPGPPSPSLNFQPIAYTPEVMAAREAHFRAYDAAARLAAESDLNPGLLMQLYRNQPNKAQTFVYAGNLGNPEESGLRATGKPSDLLLSLGSSTTNAKTDSLQKASTLLHTGRTINSVVDKLPALNLIMSGDKSKHVAEIILTCGTALKVKDSGKNQKIAKSPMNNVYEANA